MHRTLLAIALAAAALVADPKPTVAQGQEPPTQGTNPWYVTRREPLRREPLIKLPVGQVRARGWLATQLDLMAEGMFGRLPEHSRWCRPEKSAWRSQDGSGEHGWEELP